MSYFSDILDGSHKKLGVESNEPCKIDDPKAMAVKVKSGKNGLSLAQSLDMSKKGDDWKYGSKVEASKKFDEEHTLKLTAKNKEYEGEWKFNPADLNKDGTETQLKVVSSCNPAGKSGADCDVKAKLSLGGFGNDTVKSWTDVEVTSDLKTLKKAKFSESLSIKNDDQTYSIGGKGVWNNASKQLDEIEAQFVASGFKWGETWARAAILNAGKNKGQFVSAGACFKENKKQVFTSEVTWDLTNKFQGFQGMPLLWNLSTAQKYTNGASYTGQLFLAKQWMAVQKLESPVTDGVKLVYQCNFDAKKMLLSPKDFQLKTGLTIELKL